MVREVAIHFIYFQIFEEESLLAVALFPLLSELVIHSNPLTTQTNGKHFMCATLYFFVIFVPKCHNIFTTSIF